MSNFGETIRHVDKKRRLLKVCLKQIDEASLRTICKKAMLTDTETDIIACTCSRKQDINYIADTLNVSPSTLQRFKFDAVVKLLFRLRINSDDNLNEIKFKVEQFLFS